MSAASTTPRLPSFPPDDAEAQARFDEYRSKDPFPKIRPALLNSADLLDYIAAVGMLSPYNITPDLRNEWLKPASCAVGCTGDVLRFGFDKARRELMATHDYTLEEGKRLELPANSITFLQLGTTFRIPDYIAARFNLAIREIHRGILVGTGPLVDPGFVGRLFVPLHNLTSNDYSIKFDEPLAWVEFTKLSPNLAWWQGRSLPRRADFVPFPERKLKRKTPAHYLDAAHEGKPIASSIPQEVDRAIVVAEEALNAVRALRNIGFGAAVIAAIAVLLPMVSLVSDTNNRIDNLAAERSETSKELLQLGAEGARAQDRIADLGARIDSQAKQIRRLRARAASLQR